MPQDFTIPFLTTANSSNRTTLTTQSLANYSTIVRSRPCLSPQRLKDLRERLQHGKIDGQLRAEVLKKVNELFPGKGVFVRSSSNSEDLPNFSGAGLYSTVPNARGSEPILEAIKTVWASIWNFEAYEARDRAGVDYSTLFMAVLIQEGVNSESWA